MPAYRWSVFLEMKSPMPSLSLLCASIANDLSSQLSDVSNNKIGNCRMQNPTEVPSKW